MSIPPCTYIFRCMVGLVYDIQAQKSVIVCRLWALQSLLLAHNGYDSCACLCFIFDLGELGCNGKLGRMSHSIDLYQEQKAGFFSRNYHNRKFFYCIDGTIRHRIRWIDGFESRVNITQISVDDIPSNIKMPTGHPIKNTLYIGHPCIPNRYIPFDEYEATLMSEKLDEFCWLCQNLGAKEIHLVNENSLEEFCSRNSSSYTGGSVGYSGFGASGSYGSSSSSSRYNSSFFRCKINQTFANPVTTPRIPNDLIWFEHEDSWKNLVRQSSLGMGEYHVNIETGSVCMTNQ